MKKQLDRIEARLERLEDAVLALLDALSDESDEEEQVFDLDGELLGEARDLMEPL